MFNLIQWVASGMPPLSESECLACQRCDPFETCQLSSATPAQRGRECKAPKIDFNRGWWLDPAEPLLPCRLRLHGRLSPPPLTPRGPERRCHPGGHNEGEGFEHATGSEWWKMKRRAQARNGLAPWQRYVLGPSGHTVHVELSWSLRWALLRRLTG